MAQPNQTDDFDKTVSAYSPMPAEDDEFDKTVSAVGPRGASRPAPAEQPSAAQESWSAGEDSGADEFDKTQSVYSSHRTQGIGAKKPMPIWLVVLIVLLGVVLGGGALSMGLWPVTLLVVAACAGALWLLDRRR